MVPKLQPVRGTHDLLPEDSRVHQWIDDCWRQVSGRYGFEEIRTPIFEFTHVFAKSLGEATDIVSKEMYVFEDRGGESLCLRPEGTAAVARSFVSEGLAQRVPLKLRYSGPMFRYERPQKGRTRQFYQLGAEFFGVDKPQADIEVLCLAQDLLEQLGLKGKFQLEINSLGDRTSREAYRKAFVDFLSPLKDQLSEESQIRLTKNPLRILDSKSEADQKLLEQAPAYSDFLNEESQDFFQQVQQGLTNLEIPFVLNDKLVRGLDYYDHVVFEFTTNLLGAQNALLAGGRYNGLIETMGGRPTPAVGFAAGIERLGLLLEPDSLPPISRPLAIVPANDSCLDTCMRIARTLRKSGYPVDLGHSGNFAKRLKRANKLQATHAFIIGDDELANKTVTIKNLDLGEQESLPLASIENWKRPSAEEGD